MTFRIAIVQPISHRPGEDERNVADAVRAIEHAAARGRRFRLLSGNLSGPVAHAGDVRSDRGAGAKPRPTHGVHVVFGTIEPIDRKAATAHNLIVMAYPDGRAAGALPAHPSERSVDLYRRAELGNSNTFPATNFRSSTRCTARSDSPCAAKSICRK